MSAPVMTVALFLITGVRERNVLITVFLLMATTMFFGFLTELIARPDIRDDDGYRGWVGDTIRSDSIRSIERRRRKAATSRVQFNKELTEEEKHTERRFSRLYVKNYVRRMTPHLLGFVPYTAVWYTFFLNFSTQLEDLKREDQALFDSIPDFVPVIIAGSVLIFSSFTFVQLRWQWLGPDEYWKTELMYCLLSLTSKVFLGGQLFANVLMFSSVEAAMADTPATRRLIPPPTIM